jgi:hypothetical protein
MPVRAAELHEFVEASVGPVAHVERRPSEYRTSFALDELDVRLEDGALLELVLKDVSTGGLAPGARDAKPGFLHDPRREIEVYRHVVEPLGLGPKLYGSIADGRRFWLLLERVRGVELFQVGELEIWQEVARWLARMHDRCRDVRAPRLLRYDRGYYERWLRRAREVSGASELDRLAAGYPAVVERLLELPRTFVHGELYASNVLVAGEPGALRVCPVDWEMAGVAPGLVDLAALASGRWSPGERREIALAYRGACATPEPPGGFEAALDCCRLHLALQWLGWASGWEPPDEHAQDWLGEALGAAERIGL